MARVNFNFKRYEKDIEKASLDRLEMAAKVIQHKAKQILRSKVKGDWKEHGPYKTRRKGGETVGYMSPESSASNIVYGGTGAVWTERMHDAMAKTIRVVRRDEKKNIWVMAGNYKTWWAIQLEYGRGQWRGGNKSFMRPAMRAEGEIRSALHGGAISEANYLLPTRSKNNFFMGGV